MNKSRRTELWRAVKFTLISASAGIIQAGSFALLNELVRWPGVPADADYGPNYFIALALSVIWNFTFNRKYTFKSAANVPTAMLKVFCYYLVFTPLSIWWGVALTQKAGWNEYLVLAMTMVINFVTEFLYQRFFVFGKTIDTNAAAQRQKAAEGTDGAPSVDE